VSTEPKQSTPLTLRIQSISGPPYEKWDFTLGNAVRFGGPAAERFDDTIVVGARAQQAI